jgi:membrane protein YdbS with pleckstrin-like domain
MSKQSSGSEAAAAIEARRRRIMNAVRVGITMFIVVLLAIVTLGWIWTAAHQPPPLRTASHVVLSLAALAGIFALTRIWRSDPPRAGAK